MAKATLKLEGASIVLLGSFNPMIFQPRWLVDHELASEDEIEDAAVELLHPEIASFAFGPLKLDVARDRFQVETAESTAHELLRDFVIGAFRLLRHTPIRAMGLNRNAHYQMSSRTAWNDLGHKLAPKDPWQDLLQRPGTRSLTIEGIRPDAHKGYIRVLFEPSIRFEVGVFLAVNDHLEIEPEPRSEPGAHVVKTLAEQWDESMKRSDRIMHHILDLV